MLSFLSFPVGGESCFRRCGTDLAKWDAASPSSLGIFIMGLLWVWVGVWVLGTGMGILAMITISMAMAIIVHLSAIAPVPPTSRSFCSSRLIAKIAR